MPSDANGVFSLPSGYLAVTGEVIQASQHNPPLEDLASAMSARLMRSGAAPMTGALKIVDGSVGSPAVQFANGSSTGFYKTTNGVGLAISGVKVAEFVSGGMASGSRWLGELIPYTGTTAPPLTVLPYGQTLSRTTYADLWAFAQTEIAAGNLFYNNGNGSTTFGIGDMRGRVSAGKGNMGGTDAARLDASMVTPNGTTIGAVGGVGAVTLTTFQIPVHSHANSLNDPGHSHELANARQQTVSFSGPGPIVGIQLNNGQDNSVVTNPVQTGITITNANAGSGGSHNNVQPTMITNYVLFAGGPA